MNHYLMPETLLFYGAVALVASFSAARITRLVTYDVFPPIKAVRDWYGEKAKGDWAMLLFCGYCFGFWAFGLVLFTGLASDWHPVWWVVNAWFAGGYLAAIIMANDGED